MDRNSQHRAPVGLTLIELTIALAVIGIVLMAGVPTLRATWQRSQVDSGAHRLMLAILFTRSEAARRNIRVSMCPSTMAASGRAECGGSYADGWIVFQNADGDRVVDGSDELIRVYEAIPPGYTLTNRAGPRAASEIITYRPNGTSGRNRTLLVCAPAGQNVPPRSVVINNVGRPRLASNWGSCPGA